MLTLGFDPSLTNFGWALHDDAPSPGTSGRLIVSGRFQTKASALYITRYTEMRDSVIALIARLRAEHGALRVAQESPVFGSSYSEGLYGLFLYVSEALYLSQTDVVHISPGQAKAHARDALERPSGWVMQKPDMVEAAKKDAGLKKALNHNEADAYWVGRTGARFWRFLEGGLVADQLTPTEKHQFARAHTFQRGKRAGETELSGLVYREDQRFFKWSSVPLPPEKGTHRNKPRGEYGCH